MNGDEQSSLELLLDTITNTFGGILFLAMLVVILLQISSQRQPRPAPPRALVLELATARNDIEALRSRKAELNRAISLQDTLATQLKAPLDRQDIDAIRRLREQCRVDSDDCLALTKQLVEKQQVVNRLAQTIQDLNKRLELKQQDAARAQDQLEQEINRRTTTAKLPKLHITRKAEIAVVVRYARLYFVHRCATSLHDHRPNLEDMIVLAQDGDSVELTPKPYAGLAIGEGPNWRASLQKRLHDLPAAEAYLAIAVWEDSFASFIPLKNVLVAMGYEYRVLPIRNNGQVIETRPEAAPLVQ